MPITLVPKIEDISDLLIDPALLYKIGLKLEKQGYIGEQQNKLAVYLALTTKDYKRDERICIISKGESGGGKSKITVNIPERYFADSVQSFTRMTAHAPEYWKTIIDTLDGKILIIKQLEGAQDIQYTIQIMTDTTSGGLKLLTVAGGESGEMAAQEVTLDGFPVLISTTVQVNLDPQTMRRFYTEYPDDSPEQTKRILIHKAKMMQDPSYKKMVETTDDTLVELPKRLKNESAKYDVIIPFAQILAEEIFPSTNMLSRSDFDKFCSFIKAITHLYFKQRLSYSIEPNKVALISSPIDCYYAWKIVEASIPKRLAGITDDRAMRVLETLQKHADKKNSLSTEDITRSVNTTMGKSYSRMTVWQTLNDLSEKGFVESKKADYDNRVKMWKSVGKIYGGFEIAVPNRKIEDAYIQCIADKIGSEFSADDKVELIQKSMRSFDLMSGMENTNKVVSEALREILRIN